LPRRVSEDVTFRHLAKNSAVKVRPWIPEAQTFSELAEPGNVCIGQDAGDCSITPLDRLLKPRTGAERLGVGTKKLKRPRRDRYIPYTEIALRVYRYLQKGLEKWIWGRTQKPLR